MTPTQIRKERESLDKKIKQLEKQIETLRFERKQLQRECEHPDMSHYTDIDGSRGGYCSTCGYSD